MFNVSSPHILVYSINRRMYFQPKWTLHRIWENLRILYLASDDWGRTKIKREIKQAGLIRGVTLTPNFNIPKWQQWATIAKLIIILKHLEFVESRHWNIIISLNKILIHIDLWSIYWYIHTSLWRASSSSCLSTAVMSLAYSCLRQFRILRR